jgi:hypothetical protein
MNLPDLNFSKRFLNDLLEKLLLQQLFLAKESRELHERRRISKEDFVANEDDERNDDDEWQSRQFCQQSSS